MMKRCSSCQNELPLSDFSPQKQNPSKLYAWCDGCRLGSVPHVKPFGKSTSQEYKALRNKAKDLRFFTPQQDVELRARYVNGEKVKDLAKEFGTCDQTVYKAIHRAAK